MERKASAVWIGGFKDGKGAVSASSGVLSNMPYSFASRFESQPGTNPEELLAGGAGRVLLDGSGGATRQQGS